MLPAIRSRYDTAELRVKEAFVVKYDAGKPVAGGPEPTGSAQGGAEPPRQAGLEFHRDGTLLNCVVLLSGPSDFEGGGTMFAPPVGRTYRTGRGDCLCSCGQLLHGAAAVTRGVRYVMIAFIDEMMSAPEEEDDERDV